MRRLVLAAAVIAALPRPSWAYTEAWEMASWCKGDQGENMRIFCAGYLGAIWESYVHVNETCKNRDSMSTELQMALFSDFIVSQRQWERGPAVMVARLAFKQHGQCNQ